MIELRTYQRDALQDVRAAFHAAKEALPGEKTGHAPAIVLVAPTGSGKGVCAASLCETAVRKSKGKPDRKRPMFVAPRRKLVEDLSTDFRVKFGLSVGVLMAGWPRPRETDDVIVASMDTILARVEREGFPDVGVLILDEVHHSTMGPIKTLVDHYREKGVPVIGLTATPARGDGKGLGLVFDGMVHGPSVAMLTEKKFLVPVKYYAPSEPDMKGVKTTGGDWNQKQAGERMAPLIGDVVKNWLRIAPGQKTVVFTVTIANAKAICESFIAAGIAAEWISGETPEDEQQEIFKRHESGQTTVLCNAQLLSFGWDSPPVTCCILAKPTKSIANYLQMAGRVLRPYAGKEYATIIDHAGIVQKLGMVDDDFGWTLDGNSQAGENKTRKAAPEEKAPVCCPACKALHAPAPKCPVCDFVAEKKAKAPAVIAADLQEVQRKEKKKLRGQMTNEDKSQFYAELRGWCQQKGTRDGMAYYMYRDRFDAGPFGPKPSPQKPSKATLDWIASRAIARQEKLKAFEKQAAMEALQGAP